MAGHKAMPFGCTASVHHWDRTGALLRHLARTLLNVPVSRYVDDFFAEDIGHALQCLARLIRALMGDDALANESDLGMRHLSPGGIDQSRSARAGATDGVDHGKIR